MGVIRFLFLFKTTPCGCKFLMFAGVFNSKRQLQGVVWGIFWGIKK
jgi:hypothetical protein